MLSFALEFYLGTSSTTLKEVVILLRMFVRLWISCNELNYKFIPFVLTLSCFYLQIHNNFCSSLIINESSKTKKH